MGTERKYELCGKAACLVALACFLIGIIGYIHGPELALQLNSIATSRSNYSKELQIQDEIISLYSDKSHRFDFSSANLNNKVEQKNRVEEYERVALIEGAQPRR